jgi:hypothetical protein
MRDTALLPVHRARLERERRRARRNEHTLPVALSRSEAGTPTAQDDALPVLPNSARPAPLEGPEALEGRETPKA